MIEHDAATAEDVPSDITQIAMQSSTAQGAPSAADTASKTAVLLWPAWVRRMHWVTATLLLLGVAAVLMREWIDDHAINTWLIGAHRQIGLTILVLTLIRLSMRAKTRRPRSAQSTLTRFLSSATHTLAYAALLSLPVLGWAYTNAKGKPVALLGMPLPSLVERDSDLADTLQSLHSTLGWALLALIGLHVLAALWHHFIKKDAVLRSMLGSRS